MQFEAGPLLSQITTPEDLRKLPKSDLPQVCAELRQFIIDNVSVNGGHFGASLGVTELTVALHCLIPQMINWFGTWDTKPMATRF